MGLGLGSGSGSGHRPMWGVMSVGRDSCTGLGLFAVMLDRKFISIVQEFVCFDL